MPSKLGKYHLLRTLGQGAYSKVKLALDSEDNKHYAIKVHKADDPKFNASCIDVVENEAKAMMKLNHPGIVNIVNYYSKATVEKANG